VATMSSIARTARGAGRRLRPWARSATASARTQPAVVRCMGQLVPLRAPQAAREVPVRDADARMALLLAWTGSGELSWGEAEALLALEETAGWAARG
jgi:hypothetical protein